MREAERASLLPREAKALKPPPRVTKLEQRPINEIIENMWLTKTHSLDQEAIRLVEEVRTKIKKGEMISFRSAMDAILHRYEGHLNPLVLELIDLLDHEQKKLEFTWPTSFYSPIWRLIEPNRYCWKLFALPHH